MLSFNKTFSFNKWSSFNKKIIALAPPGVAISNVTVGGSLKVLAAGSATFHSISADALRADTLTVYVNGDGTNPSAIASQMAAIGVRSAGFQATARAGATPSPQQTKFLWELPPLADNYVGRTDELIAIHEKLQQTGTGVVVQKQAIVSLGGMGKSQLAIKYAHEYARFYNLIKWLRADSKTHLFEGLWELAKQCGVFAKDETELLKNLARHFKGSKKILLILDNADAPKEVIRHANALKVTLLFTSRVKAWPANSRIELSGLKRQDSASLIMKETNREDEVGAGEVAKLLGDFPLALTQAGCYMDETGKSFAQFCDKFRRSPVPALAQPLPESDPYPALKEGDSTIDPNQLTIAKILDLTMTELEEHCPEAKAVLDLCSVLDPDHMPDSIFTSFGISSSDLEKAKAFLHKYSLVSHTGEGMSMHRLTQIVARYKIGDQVKLIQSLLTALTKAFQFAYFDLSSRKSDFQLAPHVRSVLNHAERLSLQSNETMVLHNRLGKLNLAQAKYELATIALMRADELSKTVHGEESMEHAQMLIDRADSLYRVGNYDEMKTLLSMAKDILKRRVGEDHGVMECMAHAESIEGLGFYRLGQYDDAMVCFTKIETTLSTLHGTTPHPAVAANLRNMGRVMYMKGLYLDSRKLLERAREQEAAVYKSDHPETSASRRWLGKVLYRCEEYGRASQLFTDALGIDSGMYGTNIHPSVARDTVWCAHVKYRQCQFSDAEKLYDQTLDILGHIYQKPHPYIFAAEHGKAVAFYDKGEYEKALELFRSILEKRTEYYGKEEHLRIARTLHRIGNCLLRLGNLQEAELSFVKSLAIFKSVLKQDAHPRIAMNLMCLGLVAFQKGFKEQDLNKRAVCYEEASSFFDQAETIQAAVYGDKGHRDVASLHVSKAEFLLADESRLSEAKDLLKATLSMQQTLYEHENFPRIAFTYTKLAQVHLVAGELVQAEDYLSKARAIHHTVYREVDDNHYESNIRKALEQELKQKKASV